LTADTIINKGRKIWEIKNSRVYDVIEVQAERIEGFQQRTSGKLFIESLLFTGN